MSLLLLSLAARRRASPTFLFGTSNFFSSSSSSSSSGKSKSTIPPQSSSPAVDTSERARHPFDQYEYTEQQKKKYKQMSQSQYTRPPTTSEVIAANKWMVRNVIPPLQKQNLIHKNFQQIIARINQEHQLEFKDQELLQASFLRSDFLNTEQLTSFLTSKQLSVLDIDHVPQKISAMGAAGALEFLGDAVINFLARVRTFNQNVLFDEHKLTSASQSLVSNQTLTLAFRKKILKGLNPADVLVGNHALQSRHAKYFAEWRGRLVKVAAAPASEYIEGVVEEEQEREREREREEKQEKQEEEDDFFVTLRNTEEKMDKIALYKNKVEQYNNDTDFSPTPLPKNWTVTYPEKYYADHLEALFGAKYLDGGLDEVSSLFDRLLPTLEKARGVSGADINTIGLATESIPKLCPITPEILNRFLLKWVQVKTSAMLSSIDPVTNKNKTTVTSVIHQNDAEWVMNLPTVVSRPLYDDNNGYNQRSVIAAVIMDLGVQTEAVSTVLNEKHGTPLLVCGWGSGNNKKMAKVEASKSVLFRSDQTRKKIIHLLSEK